LARTAAHDPLGSEEMVFPLLRYPQVSVPRSPPLRKMGNALDTQLSAVPRCLVHFPRMPPTSAKDRPPFNTFQIVTGSLQLSTFGALFGLGGLPSL
jgi:hypothetical protein